VRAASVDLSGAPFESSCPFALKKGFARDFARNLQDLEDVGCLRGLATRLEFNTKFPLIQYQVPAQGLPTPQRKSVQRPRDKAYDTSDFIAAMRQKCVTPHVAQKIKGSAIDGRTTRHAGYGMSQRKRKLVEEAFGWARLSPAWPR
jgi:hypothetical protein